jgi:hypothetical protein
MPLPDAPASNYARMHDATRMRELRAAFLRELRLGRRPTTLEATEIDQCCRLLVLAELAAADPSTSLEDRIRTERAADGVVRRLLRLARPRLEHPSRAPGMSAGDIIGQRIDGLLREREGAS